MTATMTAFALGFQETRPTSQTAKALRRHFFLARFGPFATALVRSVVARVFASPLSAKIRATKASMSSEPADFCFVTVAPIRCRQDARRVYGFARHGMLPSEEAR